MEGEGGEGELPLIPQSHKSGSFLFVPSLEVFTQNTLKKGCSEKKKKFIII